MNKLQVFENSEFGTIRGVEINGESWLVGKDVAEQLGYADPNKAIATHVDDEDKLNDKTASSLGQRGGWFINESGFYSLVLSSKMPKAKKFKHWVTSEVLPSIRKHGMYAVDEVLANPDMLISALQALKKEREEKVALQQTVAIQSQQIMEMQPKASYYDLILQNKSTMPISQIAKDYGMSAKQMNKLLHEYGVQYKQGDIWLLYQKYAVQGYTQSRTYAVDADVSKLHTYWTQKGRLFLYDLLKSHDILPLIERN